MGELNEDPFRAARLILTLRREGVTDGAVLRAVETVPRTAFIEPELTDLAYEDCVLPIGCGQTLERPSVVGAMLQALRLGDIPDGRLLIIGAGSGYTAALAAGLCGEVFATERYRRLTERAMRNLKSVAIDKVSIRHSDGLLGWPERGPFDRILLTGEVEAVPGDLLKQLYPDGLCVAPVAEEGTSRLVSYGADGNRVSAVSTVFHTPLQAGVSKAL